VEYKPEEDHRHYLYKEYLRIIQNNKPAVFVMENVKGILSSKVAGELIFPQILQDLADPDVALGFPSSKFGKYKIISLVSDEVFESGDDPKKVKLHKFTIKSEDFGIPQSRHRVILVGVSEKYADGVNKQRLHISDPVTIEECIGKLPRIRSKISKGKDNDEVWSDLVLNHVGELLKSLVGIEAACPKLLGEMIVAQSLLREQKNLSCGKTRLPRPGYIADDLDLLHEWLEDDQLTVWLNHESRKHMSADLRRYVYASIFAAANNRSPKGHDEFNLPGLAPAHKNWKTGNFKDRFKVQVKNSPSSTITSHISKDGHYFIHYDYTQCRSLTVREAARLQTFPDNYLFMGTRTEQYHQVGNAVPPLLAYKIAKLVKGIIDGSKLGKAHAMKTLL
jgi:DNA (cytosine-5)-methyltransferase 1